MNQTNIHISVWFVCKLCRGSFGQVGAFIEHKKQKHFTQFQNTTSIVFQETEHVHGLLNPGITNNGDHQLADESNEPRVKIEVNHEDPVNPFSSEIIDELNLDLVETKSELITYESEINPDNENNFFDLEQLEHNPYVLLKRLTTEEIQSAGVPQHHSSLLKCEQTMFTNTHSFEPANSSDASSSIRDHIDIEKSAEIQPTETIRISTEHDLQFECKLCSKQLESDGQLKIHVGICALYHEDRNRFCVPCNRKLFSTFDLKRHRLRFHGTEEEKLSLFKFKCHLCPKQYQFSIGLRCHLASHKKKKPKNVTTSTSKPFKCSHTNCGKEFRFNCDLQRHITSVHLGVRPFSCSFLNCNKTFTQRGHLNTHLHVHTGERPYKCTVDNCNKVFTTSRNRYRHNLSVHYNL